MYHLSLTEADFEAICFVGYRYGWSNVLFFKTENEARDYAKRESARSEELFIIKSHCPEYPDAPYCVDNDAFCRNWEWIIARYQNGREIKN